MPRETTTYAELLASPVGGESTDRRILDAALELFAELGITRVSIDDIARRAGVNRATLYRRIGGKDAVVRAALIQETTRILDDIATRLRAIPDDRQRIIDGLVITVTTLRAHPILHKVLAVDREQTLAAVTLDAGDILNLATVFVAQEILTVRPDGNQLHDIEPLAGMLVRLTHSLVLIPDTPPRLDTDDALRDFAARYLVPLVRSDT
ncbi:helix-turn-helix domain-containing protein [Nocardia sp. NPDC052112]|uniref:TetR/AcrR family transcriptional regulator n=1 Tax=Nocardia sp. NPDC052112 TaxID=3155646 RepID=UPI003422403B